MKNCVKNTWQNYGDVNFFDYGGVMVKKDDDLEGSYNFFYLAIAEGRQFAFLGTICDLIEYKEEQCLKDMVTEFEETSVESLITNNPEKCVVELVNNYGCGPFEFSPCNHRGQCAYSFRWEDFEVTDQELITFMKEVGLPEEVIPQL